MDDFHESRASESEGAEVQRELWRAVRTRLPIAVGVTVAGAFLFVFLTDPSVIDSETLRGFLENLWRSVGSRGRVETIIGLAVLALIGVGAFGWAMWPAARTETSRLLLLVIAGAVVLAAAGFALLRTASGGPGQVVAGRVDGPDEAFCAGLSATLRETDVSGSPDLASLSGVTFAECLAEGLPGVVGITPDVPVENAYAVGCAVVVGTSSSEPDSGLDEETVASIAFSICYRPFDELDPENFGLEPVITEDGLCYPGFGEEAGVQGCLDEEGNYVTTTTVSFRGNASRDSAVLAAAREAFGNTLSGIGDESAVLDYAGRICDLYESGYGYEFIDEVADLRDNAVAWPGVAEEDLARFKSAAWEFPTAVVDELCPAHDDELASDRAEFATATWEPDSFGFGGTLGYAFDGIEVTDPGGWGHHYRVYRDLGRDFWVDFGLDVCRDLDKGQGYGSVRDAVLDVLRSDGSGETEADAFFGYQIGSAITFDLCPRHYRRFHDFEDR